MPPWFIDIESATDTEAKSKATPPASRTPAQAWRANSPRSALQGVTRPSVEATPTKGLARSSSPRPRPRRKARCGARSRPSTVMREGSFFILVHDLGDVAARRKPELRGARRARGFGHGIHHLLKRRVGLETRASRRALLDRAPHLAGADRNAFEEHRAIAPELRRRQVTRMKESLHHLPDRDARHGRVRTHRADVVATGERLADERARPARNGGVGA